MAHHFLLAPPARALNADEVRQLTEIEAYALFKRVRWPETDGTPVCPWCGGEFVYTTRTREGFKCGECRKKFSATTGTPFAYRKMPYRQLLQAVALFLNGSARANALKLSRELGVQYVTAHAFAASVREALRSSTRPSHTNQETL